MALDVTIEVFCRSPHGERGLKYQHPGHPDVRPESLPTRGAWIEIAEALVDPLPVAAVAPHTGSVD